MAQGLKALSVTRIGVEGMKEAALEMEKLQVELQHAEEAQSKAANLCLAPMSA